MYLKKVHFVLCEFCLNFFNPYFCIKAPGFQKSPISLVTLLDKIISVLIHLKTFIGYLLCTRHSFRHREMQKRRRQSPSPEKLYLWR